MKTKLLLVLIIFLAFFLRFFQVDTNPPALYWDEASLGYNAYSIATTLRDEHGIFLPLASFAAFGDYKAPGYIYSIVPFIKFLGLTELAVRLPSVLAGTLLVFVTFLLTFEVFKKNKLALLACFFVAISPWSIQMSRAAFEANLATLFSALGVLLFLRKNIISAVFFALAMYTFNSHRVFVPLIIAVLVFINIKDILNNWKKWLAFSILFFVLLLPLIPFVLSKEGKLRFNEVTWFNNLSIVEESNAKIAQADNAFWAKVIYNRRVFYAGEFISHYFDHYRFNYLFQTGDINPRLSTQAIGELYLWDLPFCLVGLIYLIRKRNKTSALILAWLVLAPIPAAVAKETPHALRTLNVLPIPQILSALGLVTLWKLKPLKIICSFTLPVIFGLVLFGYLTNYYFVYPIKYSSDWQYGYKQMVEYVSDIAGQYDNVQVTGKYGRPNIYFLFYNKYPLEKYLANRQASVDQFGFWTVKSFDKYVFDTNMNLSGKVLVVADPGGVNSLIIPMKTIYDPAGKPIFVIYD